MKPTYEVIIVGGGPAGMSAALVLGRARRKILIIDNNQHRNRWSHGLHGYLTRDGIVPTDFLDLARQELARYDVHIEHFTAKSADKRDGVFYVTLDNGQIATSRMLLLATGVRDRVPNIPGIQELYGTSVHHCPYCDGWEWRDKPLAVIGRGKGGLALSMKLRNWTSDIVLCTHGPVRYSFDEQAALEKHNVRIEKQRIERVEGENGFLKRIIFRNGSSIERDAIFFTAPQDQSCDLPNQLKCEMTSKGVARTDTKQATNVPGLYVAGDAARDMHFVIVAAAEGAKAAVAINEAFIAEMAKDVVEL